MNQTSKLKLKNTTQKYRQKAPKDDLSQCCYFILDFLVIYVFVFIIRYMDF